MNTYSIDNVDKTRGFNYSTFQRYTNLRSDLEYIMSGGTTFDNDGYSEVWQFRYGLTPNNDYQSQSTQFTYLNLVLALPNSYR